MNARIAIPYSEGQVFQHFGKSAQFKVYTIAEGKVASAEVLDTNGAGHEELGLWLVQQGVNAVICGGIGPGAQGALMAAGIQALAGVEGSADDAIANLLAGKLVAAQTATCGCRHDHCSCGSHCGGHGGHCGSC